MEPASAVVSFFGLTGPVAQGLKFLYDFKTNMKDCPKDIRKMRTEIELAEDLITQVVRQCNKRNEQLQESAPLARAIRHVQESVEDLSKELDAYRVDGKRKRFRFAARVNQTQKLRDSLHRDKAIMVELKNQLQSDALYDIRDTNREVPRTVEKTSRNSEAYNRNFHKVTQNSEVQTETTNNFGDITDLLTKTKISSSPISSPPTPALSRDVSDSSVMSLSQETTASSISSLQIIPQSVSQNARQANLASKHPLLQFKDNQFQFLIAMIFTQLTKNKHRACQRASECLAAYPTPEALSKASPEALTQFFRGIGLQEVKPLQLIKLARAYIKDPPEKGRLRSKVNCPQSEVSHLPRIGLSSINAWLVYCCERTDVVTKEKPLLEYMEYLKTKAGANRL